MSAHSAGLTVRCLVLIVVFCGAGSSLWAVGCEPCPSEGAGCVQGIVVDITGEWLPGASVRLPRAAPGGGPSRPDGREPRTTSSGGEGRFFIAGVPAGSYRIELALPGFITGETAEFLVTEGQTLDLGELVMDVGTDQTERSTIAHGVSVSCIPEGCTTDGRLSPEELLAWVDWIEGGSGEAEVVQSSGEPAFVRARPGGMAFFTSPERPRDDAPAAETDVSLWRCVFDTGRFNAVRIRIRHLTAFTHFGGIWLHRHGAVHESIDLRVDLPCFQAQPVPGDGEWHEIVLALDGSPNWDPEDDVVFVHLGFTGAGGACGYDTRPGRNQWAPAYPAEEAFADFVAAAERTAKDAYLDVALLEFLKM